MIISIHKLLTNLIIIPFIILGLYSFLFLGRKGYIVNNVNVFEILVFLYLVSLFIFYKTLIHRKGFYIFIINIVYISLSFIYAVIYNKVNILDFLLAFKSFIYLAFLTLIINKHIFNRKIILRFINIIYVIFFSKYLIYQIFNFNSRPIVYTENNFELMFLCILYLIRFLLKKKFQLKFLFLLGIIILLSSSRSAILMYSVIFLFVISTKIKRYKFIFLSGSFIFILLVILYVFISRSNSTEGIEGIDRYRFLQIFLFETKDWGGYQYMFGAPRITQLSTASCNELSYYKDLFSFSGKDICYSVILHSYLLRVIFDHGIIGLIGVVYFTYHILRSCNINKQIIWITIAIFILNGLSVSSFNSVFFPISMLFLMGTKYDEKVY